MASASPPSHQKDPRIYELFQLPESSTFEEVHAAYVTFIQEYVREREIAKKLPLLERRTHKFVKSGELFKEVSAAFLSHLESSRTESTDPLYGLEHYTVKHNSSCLTVHIPTESIASWKAVCGAYYGVEGTDRGVNGVQFSTTFTDDHTHLCTELGSLHITVYDTSKLLIQGTCYILWLVSHYKILQGMVLSDITDRYPGDPVDQNNQNLASVHEESTTVCVVCNKQEAEGDEFVDKLEAMQTALIEMETSLAKTKLQANAFESHVSTKLDDITRKLESIGSTPKCADTEVRQLREDNEKLRRRVQHLEETIASLKSASAATQREMSDMKLSHDVMKVKISNVKEKLENTSTFQPPQKTDKRHPPEPVLQYSLPTANRFELLSQEESKESNNQAHMTTGAEKSDTAPKQTLNPPDGNKPTVAGPKVAPGRKRVVLIGDSNAQKLKPNLLCPNVDMPRPYWSPNLFTTPTVLEELSKENNTPQTVILHVGTNDVMAKPKDTIISEFEMTVSTTQSLFPDAEIVVSAVPPRRDSNYRPHANTDIVAINTHLQNLCSSNVQLTYVNHAQLWSSDDYNQNFYESDGYHLNGDGVRIIASNLKRQATSALGLPPGRKHNRSPRRLSHRRPDNHVDSPPPYNKGRNEYRNTNDNREGHSSGDNRSWRNNGPPKPYQYNGTRGGPSRPRPYESAGTGNYVPPRMSNRPVNPTPPPRSPPVYPTPPPRSPPVYPNHYSSPPPPQWLQEWPSPLEAYGGPPRNNGRPPWLEQPTFPFYNMGRNWYGRSPGSSFGFNERPHGFN
ncbi:hypothetical protein Bbelb_198370 [Branchiostoma belcheri]|nr:hypothetical protein Bbelb_198370 [Branchiostoma belcheri]